MYAEGIGTRDDVKQSPNKQEKSKQNIFARRTFGGGH